jgi:hypothetical protein
MDLETRSIPKEAPVKGFKSKYVLQKFNICTLFLLIFKTKFGGLRAEE